MERRRDLITIGDILRPRHIDLALTAASPEEAIFSVASLLKENEHVTDWNAFYRGLTSRNPCIAGGGEFELCIPHARTSAVDAMVMSVGRSDMGIAFANTTAKIHYIFVIGVPGTLAADYLRIIGALARIFKNSQAERALREAVDPEEFLATLTQN